MRCRLRQQLQPQILRDVGVLILVDQDEFEPLLKRAQHVGVLAEQADVLQQQVAEVGGIERLQPLLIRDVKLLALAVGKARRLAGGNILGREAAVLPAVDQHRQHARGPALLVELLGLQDLLHHADLVVGVEDREIVLQADQFGVPAQDLHADRVEGAEPGHALDDLPDHLADAVFHFARRLVGEGDGKNLARMRAAEVQYVRDARGEHAGLAGTGAREHQHGAIERFHGLALLRVEVGEIRRGTLRPARARRCRPRRVAGSSGQAHCASRYGWARPCCPGEAGEGRQHDSQ